MTRTPGTPKPARKGTPPVAGLPAPDIETLTFGELDRASFLDILAIIVCATVLYAACLLPGVGWGSGADLQTRTILYGHESDTHSALPAEAPDGPGVVVVREVISDLFLAPAHVFERAVPFGDPAWRFNLFMVVLSVLTLLFLYLTVRLMVTHRLAAAMACTALIFSHAFFLHAVRPSLFPFLAFLYAVQLHQSVRHLLLGETTTLISTWVLALVGVVLAPAQALGVLAPAFYVTVHNMARGRRVFYATALVVLVVAVRQSSIGASTYPLLFSFLALQFPVLGWLFIAWGVTWLGRRLPAVLELVIVALLAAAPSAVPPFLPDLLGTMLNASLAVTLLLAMGVENFLDRVRQRRDIAAFVPPLVFVALAVLPLVTTMAVARTVRAAGIDKRVAVDRPAGVILRDTPWCDAVWYALWPPKNGQGGARFLEELERVLPEGAILLTDPEIQPVIEYAQRVDRRLLGIRAVMLAPEDQLPQASLWAASGRRIFLAGIDPAFYDGEDLGKMGELVPRENLYEWKPTDAF